MGITAEEILAEIGPVQEVLDAHDGIVNVIDTAEVTSCYHLMVVVMDVLQHP